GRGPKRACGRRLGDPPCLRLAGPIQSVALIAFINLFTEFRAQSVEVDLPFGYRGRKEPLDLVDIGTGDVQRAAVGYRVEVLHACGVSSPRVASSSVSRRRISAPIATL